MYNTREYRRVMGFKIGDKVVCIKKVKWQPIAGPKFNDELVVSDMDGDFLMFSEYGDFVSYDHIQFRKVEPKKATICATASILREFKESEIIKEVDVIEKPNPVHA